MGGHSSKIDSTNWETADGGFTSSDATPSGTAPTTDLTKLTCLPMKQLAFGTKYELTVLATEDSPIDSPLYEVVDLEMFKHGFVIKDEQGNVILRANATTVYQFFLYTKEPNYEGQLPEPGLELYKRSIVKYDSQHRQMAVFGIRAPTEEEALYVAHRTGMADNKAVLIAEVVRAPTIVMQSYRPSQPDTLVGYWQWNKPISIPLVKDKIELQVAKNSDIVLHIALVAIARGIRAAEWKGNSGDSRATDDFF
ncbi:hypothetical protein IV203_023390 [Nitzschia inconspicua]|uniref:Uncharacterized protein n=1 Tax=Nitzschia inconspicua TaxID=303405 RepID=A0A9K3KD52_9STRA|nr:hypothetical protein IV203_023390 [Nitzschia inconspicua]